MIKYLGSKRRLVPVLGDICAAVGARTALDLFTGTTRVAQEFCRRGAYVHANDVASYAQAFAGCYVVPDADAVDRAAVAAAIEELHALPDVEGYVTRVFCEQARYFQPHNGRRIDAIRAGIEAYAGTWLYPVLLTSLLEAADRVDSTIGLQMAYLKQWSRRSHGQLALRVPEFTPGTGRAWQLDAVDAARAVGPVDLAYLDPPYNQHRYFTNYHVWETLVRGDEPEHYGIACKRADAREQETKSAFNYRGTIATALDEVLAAVAAEVVVVSFNNEGFIPLTELVEMCRAHHRTVEVWEFDMPRHIGAQIGIHNLHGAKVGRVGHLRNVEYLLVCGEPDRVAAISQAAQSSPPTP